jgi:hypothetical protein
MWDGLWVHEYKRHNLVIGASFDRIYYRNYDVVFKKVLFFNLPNQWRDTDVESDALIRLATKEEFALQQPNFDVKDKNIFAIDLVFNNVLHNFYIVAKTVYLFKCEPPNDKYGGTDYVDPFIHEPFPCKKNRVL